MTGANHTAVAEVMQHLPPIEQNRVFRLIERRAKKNPRFRDRLDAAKRKPSKTLATTKTGSSRKPRRRVGGGRAVVTQSLYRVFIGSGAGGSHGRLSQEARELVWRWLGDSQKATKLRTRRQILGSASSVQAPTIASINRLLNHGAPGRKVGLKQLEITHHD
ncbi:MAG: hypothetical protein IPI57_11130 [Candidatus Competibacteraceae bacterium]|nr:hypothetical protein [Candidatus Competibacteraceae bacterium]